MMESELKQLDLLEYTCKKMHTDFISSLHHKVNHFQLEEIYKDLDIETYSVEEWNNSLSYILKDYSLLDSYGKIKQYIEGN